MNQKYTKLDGTVSIYKVKNKKWIKSNARYKPQTRGSGKKVIYSTRFGYLEQFNRKEQQGLLCPSGYSISQCFNVLRKLWKAYHISCYEKNIKRMIKYAKAIQVVQKDMGIKTTSFPNLLLYGDIFKLLEHKNQKAVEEDHSELKYSQELLEKKYEIITIADEMNKIFKEEKEQEQEEEVHRHEVVSVDIPAKVPLLLVPTPEQEVQIFTDDVPVVEVEVERKPLKSKFKLKQSEKRKVKHENRIPYKYKEANWKCKKCGEEMVPHTLEAWGTHICKEDNKELEIITMTDDIPFESYQEN
jgi:hypothetical protein